MQPLPVSPRMLFTSWHPGLAAELFSLVAGPEIGPACGWPPHTSVENSREIIENVLQGPTSYALISRESEQLLGAIALRTASAHFPLGEHEAEIGYWIGKPFWGQGLASEAVRALLTHAFTQRGITRVWAAHHSDNPASGRVLEKCGFVFDRILADVEIPLLGIRKDLRVLAATPDQHPPAPVATGQGFALRQATPQDAQAAYALLDAGRAYQLAQGFTQWTSDYPTLAHVTADIASGKAFVVHPAGEPNTIAGYVFLTADGEPQYETPTCVWLSRGPYLTIHRLAFAPEFRGRGLAAITLALIEGYCAKLADADTRLVSVRADTHPANLVMQRAFLRAGYTQCGDVEMHGVRFSYEKLL